MDARNELNDRVIKKCASQLLDFDARTNKPPAPKLRAGLYTIQARMRRRSFLRNKSMLQNSPDGPVRDVNQDLSALPKWIASADPQAVNHRLRLLLEKIVVYPSGKITLQFK